MKLFKVLTFSILLLFLSIIYPNLKQLYIKNSLIPVFSNFTI